MFIYRCAKRKDVSNDCVQYPPLIGDNSHNYIDGVEYTHFFRFAKDAEYYFRRNIHPYDSSEYHVGYTVVEVDESDISEFLGYGIYVMGTVYLENEKNLFRPLLEYAVPKDAYKKIQNTHFFRVKDKWQDNADAEVYYDSIPERFRNDVEYDEYIRMVNELCVKYGENPYKVSERVAYQIGEAILQTYKEHLSRK